LDYDDEDRGSGRTAPEVVETGVATGTARGRDGGLPLDLCGLDV